MPPLTMLLYKVYNAIGSTPLPHLKRRVLEWALSDIKLQVRPWAILRISASSSQNPEAQKPVGVLHSPLCLLIDLITGLFLSDWVRVILFLRGLVPNVGIFPGEVHEHQARLRPYKHIYVYTTHTQASGVLTELSVPSCSGLSSRRPLPPSWTP